MNEDLDLVGKTRTYAKEDAIKKLDDLKDILLFQQEEKKKEEYKAKEAGIPVRYRKYTFDSLKNLENDKEYKDSIKNCKDYCKKFDTYQEEGKGILFMGSPGRLKTTLACAVALELIKKKKITPYFLSCADLYDFRIREIKNAALVILDDLGIEYESDYAGTQLDQIIADSYNNNRIVFITTNLSGDEMKKRYHERSLDRLREMTAFVEMTEGKSIRQRDIHKK